MYKRQQHYAQGDLTLEEEDMPKECNCKAGGHIILNCRHLQLRKWYPEYTFSL